MSPSPSSTNTMSLSPINTNLTSMSPSPYSSTNTNYTGSNKPSLKPTNDDYESSYEPSPSSSKDVSDVVNDDGNGDEIVSTMSSMRDMIRRISLNMYNTIFG